MSDAGDQDFFGSDTSSSGSLANYGGLLTSAGQLAGVAGNFVAGQGNAAADQAQAQGYEAESQAYTEAAGYATGNVQLAEESTAIQQYQQQRQLAQTVGQQKAQIAGANLGPGGSGAYLLRSSMAQGALASGLIGVQGAINEQGYAAQEAADVALSNQATAAGQAATAAASTASTSSALGAIGGAAGAIGGIIGLIGKI